MMICFATVWFSLDLSNEMKSPQAQSPRRKSRHGGDADSVCLACRRGDNAKGVPALAMCAVRAGCCVRVNDAGYRSTAMRRTLLDAGV
jgi:hypothetical protein